MPRLRRAIDHFGPGHGAMALDCRGTVQHCHEDLARLFRARPPALVGRHIRELIPNLPLNAATPGYNAAYATFWAPSGQRRGFHGVDSHGRKFALRVALVGPRLRAWRERVRAARGRDAAPDAEQELLYCLCQPE